MIESTSIADGLAVMIPTPECCGGSFAVGANCAFTLCGWLEIGLNVTWLFLLSHRTNTEWSCVLQTYHSSLWFHQGPTCAVHFVVKPAGIAQVMAITIPPPQGSWSSSTIDTLTTLCKIKTTTNKYYVPDSDWFWSSPEQMRPPPKVIENVTDETIRGRERVNNECVENVSAGLSHTSCLCSHRMHLAWFCLIWIKVS